MPFFRAQMSRDSLRRSRKAMAGSFVVGILIVLIAGIAYLAIYPKIKAADTSFGEITRFGQGPTCKSTGKTLDYYVYGMDTALVKNEFKRFDTIYQEYEECFEKSPDWDVLVMAARAEAKATGSDKAAMQAIVKSEQERFA